jgi:predicted nucleic acid-binding protein
MPVSPVLADSSFYLQLLRQGQDPLRALAAIAASSDLVVCGVVRCEVVRALRPAAVRKRFQAFWDLAINAPTDSRLWMEVEQTLWELDREGNVLPLTDVVIACCARRTGAVILTYDRHFNRIPGVRTTERLDL